MHESNLPKCSVAYSAQLWELYSPRAAVLHLCTVLCIAKKWCCYTGPLTACQSSRHDPDR